MKGDALNTKIHCKTRFNEVGERYFEHKEASEPTDKRCSITARSTPRLLGGGGAHLLEIRPRVSLEKPNMEILVHHEVQPEVLEAPGERREHGELASERLCTKRQATRRHKLAEGAQPNTGMYVYTHPQTG